MSFLSRFTGPKYNDEQIAHRATVAVKEDPLIDNSVDVTVESAKGVVYHHRGDSQGAGTGSH